MSLRSSLPNSTSVLEALSLDLTPPSPILCALPTTWTSSDIPIFFDSSISTESLNTLYIPPEIERSNSARSVGTIGTFGPVHYDRVVIESSMEMTDTYSNSIHSRFSGSESFQSAFSPPAAEDAFTAQAQPSAARDHFFQAISTSRSIFSLSTASKCVIDSDTASVKSLPVHSIVPSNTFSTLSTPTFVTPLPSVDLAASFPYSTSVQPSRWPYLHSHNTSTIKPSSSTVTLPSISVPVDQLSTRGSSSSPSDSLPSEFSWIRVTSVQILIDQEGFRAVNPSFKFSGYSDGVATFMPVRRQVFNFHYAPGPFDVPPVLRRVTVNGDETRDFISRQAALELNHAGVYIARGSEVSYHAPDAQNPRKLRWRFDYVVHERRLDGSGVNAGKIIEGERTFIPLAFSCSPLLLHALQSRKIRLMHVMIKSMTPKIIAERLEPARPPIMTSAATLARIPPTTSSKSALHMLRGSPLKKAYAWNLHRRTQSQVHNEPVKTIVQSSHSKLNMLTGENAPPQPRHRRASSADGTDLLGLSTGAAASKKVHLHPAGTHILPRSHLSDLVSIDMRSNSMRSIPSGPQPLAPRPLPVVPK